MRQDIDRVVQGIENCILFECQYLTPPARIPKTHGIQAPSSRRDERHLPLREVLRHRFYFVGCKNVHFIFKSDHDLANIFANSPNFEDLYL